MIEVLRNDLFELPSGSKIPPGYVILKKNLPDEINPFLDQVVVTNADNANDPELPEATGNVIANSELYEAIVDGDIGLVSGRGSLRVILSRRANHNTLLVTERCDNRCLFCSQPPKERNDEWLLMQAAMAIAAFQSKQPIGISGGEPLLYKDTFLRFLDVLSEYAPSTPLHILTNGRAFAEQSFASGIAQRCGKLSLTFGIPLYSAISTHHDQLVGAQGAFAETLKGLINAGNSGIPIELRVIPTTINVEDIASTVELATRSLSSVSQVSVMNLEPTGWAKKNWLDLYIAPACYETQLQEAVEQAEQACLPIYLFNYPLCHLPKKLRPYAVKSISDWKNYYPDECKNCLGRIECSGYFASSRGIYHQPARRLV